MMLRKKQMTGMLEESYEVSPKKYIRWVMKHMAVLFWGVSIIPAYMGWVFATRKMYIIPSWEWEFIRLVIAVMVLGPFLGGGTLLFNDFFDRNLDKLSRRKSGFPLPKGLISAKAIFRVSVVLMVLAVVFSLFFSFLFTALVLCCILLSISYSAPPFRFKSKAGMDLVIVIAGSAVLCSLAGWVTERPLGEFPAFWLVTMVCGVSAVYIPTTIIDYESDMKAGIDTITTKLGQKGAFYLGLSFLVVANISILLMGWFDYLVDFRFIQVVWPLMIGMVVSYWYFLRKQGFYDVIWTIVGLSVFMVIANGLLLLYYTGIWKL